MCWSEAQTGLLYCNLYRAVHRRASISLLVLHLFISGFRGSDERTRCSAAALAARRRQSMRGDIQSIRAPTKRDAHGRHYSTVTPLALIGPAHFSISLLRNCARYSELARSSGTITAPSPSRLSLTLGVFIASTVASCSLLTIPGAAPLGRKMTFQV